VLRFFGKDVQITRFHIPFVGFELCPPKNQKIAAKTVQLTQGT